MTGLRDRPAVLAGNSVPMPKTGTRLGTGRCLSRSRLAEMPREIGTELGTLP